MGKNCKLPSSGIK